MALRAAVNAPCPVWPNPPGAEAFVPLVFLIVILVAGGCVWVVGSLTPQQSVWGLRGLDVLAGNWIRPSGDAAPPFYAWCTALALSIPGLDRFLLLPLPSFVFALGSVAILFLIGRRLYTTGAGLLAAFLFGLNPFFLEQAGNGDSTACIVFWAMLSLYLYSRHLRHQLDVLSLTVAGGAISFGALLLSAGVMAFWIPVVGLLDFLYREFQERDDLSSALHETRTAPTIAGGIMVIIGGLALASFWLFRTPWTVGPFAPWPMPVSSDPPINWTTLFAAMPATIVFALFGIWQTLRESVRGGDEPAKSALPVFWALTAMLAFQATQPTPAMLLLAMAPLSILAARTLFALLRRDLSDRQALLLLLAAAAAYVIAWTPALRSFVGSLGSWWQRPGRVWRSEELLGVHLAADLLIAVLALIAWLFRMTRSVDVRRRTLLGGAFVAVLVAGVAPGFGRLNGTPRRDDNWQKAYVRLRQIGKVDMIVFVGPKSPPAPLAFTTRTLFPQAAQASAEGRKELEHVLRTAGPRPLVLLTGGDPLFPRNAPVAIGDKTVTLSRVFDGEGIVAYATMEEK